LCNWSSILVLRKQSVPVGDLKARDVGMLSTGSRCAIDYTGCFTAIGGVADRDTLPRPLGVVEGVRLRCRKRRSKAPCRARNRSLDCLNRNVRRKEHKSRPALDATLLEFGEYSLFLGRLP
jgi:hypothetical protein